MNARFRRISACYAAEIVPYNHHPPAWRGCRNGAACVLCGPHNTHRTPAEDRQKCLRFHHLTDKISAVSESPYIAIIATVTSYWSPFSGGRITKLN